MLYTYNKTTVIRPIFMEEVSKVASTAYSDQAQSMYDAIVPHSRDTNAVLGLFDDAFDILVARLADKCAVNGANLTITMPDLDQSKESAISSEINRYIAFSAVNAWMVRKYPQAAEEYKNKAETALTKTIQLLFTRKKPTR